MFIDFHTHLFPDKVAPRAVDTLIAGTLREEGRAIPPRAEATESGILSLMQSECIPLSIVLPIATKPSQTEHICTFAASLNERYRSAVQDAVAYLKALPVSTFEMPCDDTLPVVMSPALCMPTDKERQSMPSPALISFASIHPDDLNAEDNLKHIAESGFLGIKLHPEFQHFDIASPRVIKLLQLAENLGLITVIHAGRDIGMPPPAHAAPEAIAHVLDYIEGNRFVAAHMGGFRMWDDVEKHLVGKPLYLDTSYLGLWDGEPTSAQFRRILCAHGTKKILFGSDYPWKTPREVVGRLKTLCLSEGQLDDIFRRNAIRLLFS